MGSFLNASKITTGQLIEELFKTGNKKHHIQLQYNCRLFLNSNMHRVEH